MKLPARSLGLALPLFLTGCFLHIHRQQSRQLAPAVPPQLSLSTTTVQLPASSSTIPPEPIENAQIPSEERPRRHFHRRKPEDKKVEEAADVLPAPAPQVSAIGQLSSGDPAAYRNQTLESIDSIEHGVNGLKALSAPDRKIADQIREFLKEARQALAGGDVDGARTLAVKAKVLLAELTK